MRFIDPDGMAIAGAEALINWAKSRGPFDDIFTVDQEGNTNLVKKTDDNFDVLQTKESWDSGRNGNPITVGMGVLESKKEITTKSGVKYNIYTTTSEDKGQSLFEFMAKNTKVEWSLTKARNNSITGYLTTSHNHEMEVGATELLDNPLIRASVYLENDHSHPDGIWQPSSSSLPLKDPGRNQGDIGFTKYVKKLFPNSNPGFRVYNVTDGTYFQYNSQTVIPRSCPEVTVFGTKP